MSTILPKALYSKIGLVKIFGVENGKNLPFSLKTALFLEKLDFFNSSQRKYVPK